MIFDTHTHLNDEKLFFDVNKYVKNAKEAGIDRVLCVGWDVNSSKKAIEIANNNDGIFASVGIMPTEHKQYTKNTINELEKLLDNKKVKAVGEIGLDYYWENSEEIKKIQKEMFISQIELANKHNLPITIHCRDAIQDTFNILKEHPVKQKGVMHCYSGSLEMAKEFIKLGYMIAFGGTLTFKNSNNIKNVFDNIPLTSIVFETDAPYLSPAPNRGKINEPMNILDTIKYASNRKNLDLIELEKISYENSSNIFHVERNEK
ncbi:MAG: TatD family hydrolase [Bacilli bacterium]